MTKTNSSRFSLAYNGGSKTRPRPAPLFKDAFESLVVFRLIQQVGQYCLDAAGTSLFNFDKVEAAWPVSNIGLAGYTVYPEFQVKIRVQQSEDAEHNARVVGGAVSSDVGISHSIVIDEMQD